MPLERILALYHRTPPPHHYQPKELAVVGQLMKRTPINTSFCSYFSCTSCAIGC